MAGSDDGFLSRWSRRKEQARAPETKDKAAEATPTTGETPPAEVPDEADPNESDIVAQLPDIESLNETSDFTVFMKEGVPQALKRQALRKLWRVNPAFSFLDGMNEYDEDFTIVSSAPVKTIYQVGKGMLGDSDEEGAEPAVAMEEPGEQPVAAAEPDSGEAAEGAEPAEEADPIDEDDETQLPEPPELLPETQVEPADGPLAVASSDQEAEEAPRPRPGSALARRWGGPSGGPGGGPSGGPGANSDD